MIKRTKVEMIDKTKETFKNVRASYFNAKRSENKEESTIELYKMHLKYFCSVLEIEDNDIIYDLNEADVIFFRNTILSEKKDTTSATYCRTIRAFLYWCMDNGYLKNRFKIIVPKEKKEVKKTYTDEELTTLLKDPRPCSGTTYQSYVFINLCIATGLRLSSMLNLKVYDVNLKEGYLIVNHTKNSKGMTRYLNKIMVNILKEYIDKFELDLNDYLFCNDEGQKIKRGTMESQIQRYNKKHKITKTSIHLFRHTFSKNFIKNGGTIHDLQKILDHSSIQVTMEYLQDLGLDQRASIEVFNPQKIYNNKSFKTGNRKRTIN